MFLEERTRKLYAIHMEASDSGMFWRIGRGNGNGILRNPTPVVPLGSKELIPFFYSHDHCRTFGSTLVLLWFSTSNPSSLVFDLRVGRMPSGRNAAINLEYLKNCVVGCLRTSEPSEHARLLPVISTILKLSKDEEAIITRNISNRAHNEGSFGGSLQPRPPANGGMWWNSKSPAR